ncbi:MAG: NAD-dependent deacylase, partial [Methylococcaceae bacterium]
LEAERLSLEAEIFICIGCSLEVQPAADLPYKALESGAYLIQVNPNVTKLDDFAHCNLRGNAGEILPLLWQAVCTNI